MHPSLGDRIRVIRKTNRLNQIEFSKLIGISQATLSEIEKDKYNPSIETVISIYKVFKTNLNWLIQGEVTNEENNVLNIDLFQTAINEKELKVLELFNLLSESDMEEIMLFMELKIGRY
ncbi:helix-turn-helix transcriptional regulator [Paenibacillus alba]|uniref:helix-turn-helix transcriptional regulator n=1 Tax=Paenibacillus alba TaxID=1197127 RepID=UPI0015632C36|nr:helix-turn-helix transcriptional regulator [Paenibacillus alba]NQX71739.1 helix-turn-helix transcriptional regulator [Paenibacillus alba]